MKELSSIKREGEGTAIGIRLAVTIFFTNMSQMPFFISMRITRYISIGIWIAFFASWLFSENQGRFSIKGFPIVAAVIINIYSYVMRFFDPSFAESDLFTPILMSAFIYLNGKNIGYHLNQKDMKRAFTAYIISSFFVCLSIYFSFLRGKSIVGRDYLYSSKNSVSQIIWTGMILIMLTKYRNIDRRFAKMLYVLAFLFMLYSLAIMKARATLICIPVVVLIILFNHVTKPGVKALIAVSMIVVIMVLSNERTYYSFINNIVYAGRSATNINDLTSERYGEWVEFGKVFFKNNYLFGNGRYKMESLVLTSLLEYGMLIGSFILVLAVYPIHYVRKAKKTNSIIILTCIAVSYAINSIFEQLAPFGPGVKCYFLWLLLGILQTSTVE